MKNRSPKKSLKQKLTIALSVVNALNMAAPIALPYVNVARNVRADGGQTEPLQGVARAFYGTAQAEETYTPTVENNTVENETIPSGGTQNVSSGGVANSTTINFGGKQFVSNGGTATSTTIQGGTQTVQSSGTANFTTVKSGGVQEIIGGGTALNTTVKSGGTLNASFGGTNVLGGSQIVESGGLVSGGTLMTVSGVKAAMTVANGGMTISSQIGAGATQTVSSGGTVLDTTVEAGGNQTIEAGGIIGGLNTVSGTVSGGTLKRVSVYDVEKEVWTLRDAVQSIEDDGTAIGVTVVDDYATQQVGGNNAVASGTVVMSGGGQFVEKGGVANGTIVNAGGKQTIDEGGTVNHTNVNKGGTQSVVQGGTANDTIVNAGGTQNFGFVGISTNPDTGKEETDISAGGVANGTIVNEGGVQNIGLVTDDGTVAPGGVANGTILNAGGTQNVNIGGTAKNTTMNGGIQNVNSGGTATYTTLKSGVQNVNSGGAATYTTLNGGVQNVNSGGAATYTTMSGGVQNVNSGGKATYTTLNGGTQNLNSGGKATRTTLNDGTLQVNDYAWAQIDTANGGTLRLLENGLAAADFGSLDAGAATTFTIASAYAQGDTVRLGIVGKNTDGKVTNHSEPGKTLTIGTMDGYANFVVNTDLKNNRSDKIEIGTLKNTTQPNTIQIAYDPAIAKGEEVTGANVTVATVANGTEKAENGEPAFKGAKTTIDFIDYTPELETKDNGRSWNIKRLTKSANEATHHTVMGMTAGMAALSAGNDFIGAATEGLSLAANTGADGVSAYAQLGGGSVRQETGSHVNMNTWNAILALGHKNEKEKSAFEYGAFFEYGSGNYTTHDGDNRGDGSVRNTGGGVLAKWTAAHGFYVEGSLRAGTVHDDASSVLRDAAGNAYGYDTNTGYWGAHIGAGKEILLANGNTLDVYGKFFYNRRNGVSFTANKNNFDLDAVTSEVIRIGARYTMKREKWNFYGGLSYEHELDGKATGTMQGLEIRGADIKGGSARLELGATMKPDQNSPWSLDLNVAGFAGKKQGVTGGVSVSFTF